MDGYVLSLVGAALISALVGVLAPVGSTAKYVKLITSLFLICVLISPVKGLIVGLRELINGDFSFSQKQEQAEEDFRLQAESLTNETAKLYFTDMLTARILSRFSISPDELRCAVDWSTDGSPQPTQITVFLSGHAIWQDTHAIEAFVTELIGVPCQSALE